MKNPKIKARDRSIENHITNKQLKHHDKIKSPFKVRNLSKEQIDELYKEHVINVNKKYQNLAKNKKDPSQVYDKYIELKRCEICTDFINDKYLLLCDICDDGYHSYCLVR